VNAVDEDLLSEVLGSTQEACAVVTGFLSIARCSEAKASGAGIGKGGGTVGDVSDIGAPIVDAATSCFICLSPPATSSSGPLLCSERTMSLGKLTSDIAMLAAGLVC